jgi:pimeloyl-ACP methyl ester carboxylesterase
VLYFWISLGVILTALLIHVLLRWYVAPKIADIFENQPPFDVAAAPVELMSECISIPTADGLTLAGGLMLPRFGQPRGLVLFFPELNGNHAMSATYCAALVDHGYALLGFDFRNQGNSDALPDYAPIHWITEYEMCDVAAVMEYVESHAQLATLPLAAFGVSRGGVAALIAAGRYPRIRAVVADSAFSTMAMTRHFVDRFAPIMIPQWLYMSLPEIHIRSALRGSMRLSETRRNCRYVHIEHEWNPETQTPVLLISGMSDSYVRPDLARHLHRICGAHAELWLVPDAKHNKSRSTSPAEYDRRVVEHISAALHDPVEPGPCADARVSPDESTVPS